MMATLYLLFNGHYLPRVTMRRPGHHLDKVPSHQHPLGQTTRSNQHRRMQSQAACDAYSPARCPSLSPRHEGQCK
ncbi:unnamed protein product [Arctogadus glacialis]